MKRVSLIVACVLALAATPAVAAPVAPGGWIEAWFSPPFPVYPAKLAEDVRGFDNQTVRQFLRVQTDGKRLRIRLTNELGTTPVAFGSVHVAIATSDSAVDPATDHVVTFGGRASATIPAGAPLVSDPVDLPVSQFQDLAVSVYYPGPAQAAAHLFKVQIAAGDHTRDAAFAAPQMARAAGLAAGVEVQGGSGRQVLVAFGDSITEGAASTPGAHMNWPEQFSRRIAGGPEGRGWVVVNSGISGNRVLHDGASMNGLARFDRDALDIPGVTKVVVLEGINDIGAGSRPEQAPEHVTAEDLIGAYRQMIARAHARGVQVYAGTLTPYRKAVYYTDEGEATRQAVNHWIRTSGELDGVVEFEKAVQDPADPLRMTTSQQHGDDLHPNDAGYTAMTRAIDLKVLGLASGKR